MSKKIKGLTLQVQDANHDVYNLNFEAKVTKNKVELKCPWCGEQLRKTVPNGESFACANGHMAYTVSDSEFDIYTTIGGFTS